MLIGFIGYFRLPLESSITKKRIQNRQTSEISHYDRGVPIFQALPLGPDGIALRATDVHKLFQYVKSHLTGLFLNSRSIEL